MALDLSDTAVCPFDGRGLIEFEDADENGVYVFFQCGIDGAAHTFRGVSDGNRGSMPDFSEVDAHDNVTIWSRSPGSPWLIERSYAAFYARLLFDESLRTSTRREFGVFTHGRNPNGEVS